MFKNYIKIAFRTIRKTKVYSIINIAGLAIGMASCILILLYTNYEKSYENFHVNAKNIFRIEMDMYRANALEASSAVTYPAVGPTIKDEIPGVITAGRIIPGDGIVRNGGIIYREDGVLYADQEILDMFTFEFIEGDKNKALFEPNSMILTESMAKKYFGNEPALYKSLIAGQNTNYKITGIIKDIPDNTHIQFDILLSFITREILQAESFESNPWGWYDFYTYALLEPGINREDFESKLAGMMQKYKSESFLT